MSDDGERETDQTMLGNGRTYGQVTTERRGGPRDWMAYWAGDRRVWEAGASEAEAVGKLYMRRHLERDV